MHVAAMGELDTRQLLAALNAFQRGDFSARLPEDWTGVAGKIADAFNHSIDTSERMAAELERVSRAVGKDGKVTQRASLGDVLGSWAASVQCVNALIADLVHPTTETARVIGVGAFAAEVTRVAHEVGTEGRLGGQAPVPGVAGTWKDLTRFFTLAPDMLGLAGFEGRLVQLNGSWESTLGLAAEELCARPIFEFLHPDDREAMRDHLRGLSEGAPTASFENRLRHGDGSYRWLSWTAAPFREEGLVYVFVRDITFRKVADEERLQLVREQDARRAAERENEIKDQFLATLSHELRSPLTPILGWTSMLRSGQLTPPDAMHALDVIERNARLQAQLIEDLLDVTRIVSGKLRMQMGPVDLRAVVEAGLEAVGAAALKRGIALEVELGPEPVRVVGDPERLQQVVSNLASNAVKFSQDRGRVRVSLDVEAEAARLRVSDDGLGIGGEFLPHVFDRFRQATAGTTRTHGGLGLGLTIVRHIVQAHGGTVEAASEGVGRGASLTVVLPRVQGDGGESAASPAAASPREEVGTDGSALRGRVVLVVDDEPDVRDVLRLVLERHGTRVVTAASVKEAVASIGAEQPDLVVSDIGMPEADGYALMDQVRVRAGRRRPAGAVALTAYASPDDAARALAAGFQAHLAKPIDPRVVVDTLVGLLRRSTPKDGPG
jgi:PAS domain S-box-containing protein